MEYPVRRVIVGVDGSVGSLRALRQAVREARLRDATVWSVTVWEPPGGDGPGRRIACPPSLLKLWEDDAALKLTRAWDEAMGGVPEDVSARLLTVRGRPGAVLCDLADRPDDLLVVGAGRRGFRRLLADRLTRFLVAHADCPVLAVPQSAIQRQFQHGTKRLVRELIADARD